MNLISDYVFRFLNWLEPAHSDQDSNRHDQLVSASFCREMKTDSLSLLENVHSLYNSSKSESLIICKSISQKINHLILITEDEIGGLEIKEKGLVHQLIHTQETHTRVYQSHQEYLVIYNDTCAQLAELESQENSLKGMLSEYNNAIEYFENEAKKAAEKRRNAFKDLIPFFGLIEGIQTGHLERAIPFYSTITGIASIVSNDKELYEHNSDCYQDKHNQVCAKINAVQKEIVEDENYLEGTKEEISRLAFECNYLDEEIKSSGVRITTLRNVNYSLKKLLTDYEFLTNDLETLNIYIEEDIIECEQFDNFSRDIQQLQRSFTTLALL